MLVVVRGLELHRRYVAKRFERSAIEFPEVFYAERPDPLDGWRPNGAAWIDGFVGNPPFSGKNGISLFGALNYIHWLMAVRPEVEGNPNTDLSAYFFRARNSPILEVQRLNATVTL